LGGLWSARDPERLPRLFLLCELGVGAFGLVSLPLLRWAGDAMVGAPWFVVAAGVFALLVAPTLLMGATLPLLVAHLYARFRHVGRAVGVLYFVNTLGSAAACFLTAEVLFRLVGQQGALVFAASCNFAVGALAWRYMRSLRSAEVETAA
jgi:hypothetical protein